MKVLAVHNHYQEFGGEDAIVALELEALRARGVDVQVYSRHNDEIKGFGVARKGFIPMDAIHSGRTVTEIREAIRSYRPDVAYVHNIYPLISPSVYGELKANGTPLVQVAHNFRPFCANGLLHRSGRICEECLGHSPLAGVLHRCFRGSLLMSAMYAGSTARARKACGRASAIICPTPFTSAKLEAAGIAPERLFVRPHFVDKPGPAPRWGGGRYALFMGRLAPEKGLETLVDAFAAVRDVDLVIAGTGPLESELRRQVAAGELANIQFAGFVSGEAKRRLLDDAMFVVVPSEWYEVFGMSLVEAYRAGKPAIGSNIGGIPYVVRHGETGYLFEPGNPTQLGERVRLLSHDVGRRAQMGEAAYRLTETLYSAAAWFDRTMEIFREVVRLSRSDVAPLVGESV